MDAALKAELDRFRTPMSVADAPRRLRAFFYGDPGAGKTTLAGQLVENRGAIFTTDSAWVVLLDNPEVASKIDQWPFQGFAQIRAFAEAHMEGIEPYASYDTIIWDTVAKAVDNTLRVLVGAKKYPKEQQDPDVEAWPHYRQVERALIDTIAVLNKSDLNVIYTAHIRDPSTQDKEKKRFAIRPNSPNACYQAIAQEVQLIGWLFNENAKSTEPSIQLKGTLQETAKSQISTLPQGTYKVSQIPGKIREWKSLNMKMIENTIP